MRLGDLVSPVGKNGQPDPSSKSFVRPGASTIYREQGERLIAVKFSVNYQVRDLGSTVAEAREKTQDLFGAPYRAVWSGEFEEMEAAEAKLAWIIPLSLGLIFLLLYIAFRSFIDSLLVSSNVVALSSEALGAPADRYELQYFGGGWVYFHFRCRHHGWTSVNLVLQRPTPGESR